MLPIILVSRKEYWNSLYVSLIYNIYIYITCHICFIAGPIYFSFYISPNIILWYFRNKLIKFNPIILTKTEKFNFIVLISESWLWRRQWNVFHSWNIWGRWMDYMMLFLRYIAVVGGWVGCSVTSRLFLCSDVQIILDLFGLLLFLDLAKITF